jgi:hypothetical protein
MMETVQDILHIEQLRRWRLTWVLATILAFLMVVVSSVDLALDLTMEISPSLLDNAIDITMICSFLIFLVMGTYFAYKNHRALQQIGKGSELPPGFYQNLEKRSYCSRCGYKLPLDGEYCEHCGHKLSK